MYAKITEGELIYAPLNYVTENGNMILNFGKNIELMTEFGFKPVQKQIPDYDIDTETIYQSEYQETEDSIIIIYKSTFKAENDQLVLVKKVAELEQSNEQLIIGVQELQELKNLQIDYSTILSEEVNK